MSVAIAVTGGIPCFLRGGGITHIRLSSSLRILFAGRPAIVRNSAKKARWEGQRGRARGCLRAARFVTGDDDQAVTGNPVISSLSRQRRRAASSSLAARVGVASR